ncbi:MAG: hypothetical protein JNM82_14295 [Rhodocyclaceae bacterium]|nr:hypothetical protein [Rhodocyclaceae bacterium]
MNSNKREMLDWDELPRIDLGPEGHRKRPHTEEWPLTLASGRTIRLDRYFQQNTTHGWLCGPPFQYAREAQVDAAVAATRRVFELRVDDRVHLVPPVLYRYTSQLPARIAPSGIIEMLALPPVCSMAEFRSDSPVRDADQVYSSLVAVWFQDRYGLPEDPYVLEMLRAMPWDALATDWTP